MCSAWDVTSLKQLIRLKIDHIKIPSACNNNYELLNYLFKYFKGYCHIFTWDDNSKRRKKNL